MPHVMPKKSSRDLWHHRSLGNATLQYEACHLNGHFCQSSRCVITLSQSIMTLPPDDRHESTVIQSLLGSTRSSLLCNCNFNRNHDAATTDRTASPWCHYHLIMSSGSYPDRHPRFGENSKYWGEVRGLEQGRPGAEFLVMGLPQKLKAFRCISSNFEFPYCGLHRVRKKRGHATVFLAYLLQI